MRRKGDDYEQNAIFQTNFTNTCAQERIIAEHEIGQKFVGKIVKSYYTILLCRSENLFRQSNK